MIIQSTKTIGISLVRWHLTQRIRMFKALRELFFGGRVRGEWGDLKSLGWEIVIYWLELPTSGLGERLYRKPPVHIELPQIRAWKLEKRGRRAPFFEPPRNQWHSAEFGEEDATKQKSAKWPIAARQATV